MKALAVAALLAVLVWCFGVLAFMNNQKGFFDGLNWWHFFIGLLMGASAKAVYIIWKDGEYDV